MTTININLDNTNYSVSTPDKTGFHNKNLMIGFNIMFGVLTINNSQIVNIDPNQQNKINIINNSYKNINYSVSGMFSYTLCINNKATTSTSGIIAPLITPKVNTHPICFTNKTLKKIKNILKDNNYEIIKSERDPNIQIIRAYHNKIGKVEFTVNHVFIYNNKLIDFENLVKENPNFTKFEIINDKIEYVYNIISKTNIFKLSDDLQMIGALKLYNKHTKDNEYSCFSEQKITIRKIN